MSSYGEFYVTTGLIADVTAEFLLAKNGTPDAKTVIDRLIGTPTDHGAMPLSGIFELATNDYVEIYCDGDKTAELSADHVNVSIVEIV